MSSIHALLEPEPTLSPISQTDANQPENTSTLSQSKPDENEPVNDDTIETVKENKTPLNEGPGQQSENSPIQKLPDETVQEIDPKYPDLNLKSFQRTTKKVIMGFGSRTFPPKLNPETAQCFQFKSNAPPGAVEAKHASLAKYSLFPKPFKCTKDQKMKGYAINKHFKPRSWKSESLSIPLVEGGTLVTTRYTTKTPHPSTPQLPYREISGLKQTYRVSTITRVIIPTCTPLAPSISSSQPYNKFPTIVFNGTPPSSRSGREKAQCTEPTCLKFFADRSSLNRHRKRMHPELVNPGSKLATHS